MREHLFRGKRIDDDKWTYGYLFKCWGRCYLLWGMNGDNPIKEEVYPETVGQYTGLTDKNSKEICEGDIVKTWKNNIGKIEFRQYWDEEIEEDFYGYAWIGKDEYGESITLSLNKCWNEHEVIGNIHDNPELLEEI